MQNNGYIRSLDGVRALAILLVLAYHADLALFGWVGVQLFFVLSGFLITDILWKEKERPGHPGYQLRKFWVRRSLRIFPLYFGYLAVLGLIWLILRFPGYYPTYISWLVTYTFNYTRTLAQWQGNPLFTHLWSLSVEEQFYLFFPLVVLLLPKRFVRVFMIVIVAAAPLIRYGLGVYYARRGFAPEVVGDAIYWNTLTHLDAFFMGGLIPVCALDRRIERPGRLFGGAALLLLLSSLADASLSGPGAWSSLGYGHALTGHYEHVWQYTCLNLCFATLVLCLVSLHRSARVESLRRVMGWSWLVRVGRVSYGMYVFHWALLVYFYDRFFHADSLAVRILLFFPYAVLVYLFAEVSYRLYEVHFLKWKDKIFPKAKASA